MVGRKGARQKEECGEEGILKGAGGVWQVLIYCGIFSSLTSIILGHAEGWWDLWMGVLCVK
jgi:hypothetical protein